MFLLFVLLTFCFTYLCYGHFVSLICIIDLRFLSLVLFTFCVTSLYYGYFVSLFCIINIFSLVYVVGIENSLVMLRCIQYF